MISAQIHSALTRQWPIQANQEPRENLRPNNARIEAQHAHAEPKSSATVLHRERRHVWSALAMSNLHHVDGVNANGLPSVTIDEVTANLARFANCVIARLTFSRCLVTALGTICEAGDYGEGLGHRLQAGNKGLGFWAHRNVSLFVGSNIRNNVPSCKRYFA